MKINTIVTINDQNKYYLTDYTEQNDKKYFLGTKVDNENNLLMDSTIFEEKSKDNKYFLTEVEQGDLYNYLSSIFTANVNEIVDNMEEV